MQDALSKHGQYAADQLKKLRDKLEGTANSDERRRLQSDIDWWLGQALRIKEECECDDEEGDEERGETEDVFDPSRPMGMRG